MPETTGTTTRVQMRRVGQALTPHGNLKSYDPDAGTFVVLFDFQTAGPPYHFTPADAPTVDMLETAGIVRAAAPPDTGTPAFTDQYGKLWLLIR